MEASNGPAPHKDGGSGGGDDTTVFSNLPNTTIIDEPGPNDVVVNETTRLSDGMSLFGNVRFSVTLASQCSRGTLPDSPVELRGFAATKAHAIVKVIHEATPPGRFLRRTEDIGAEAEGNRGNYILLSHSDSINWTIDAIVRSVNFGRRPARAEVQSQAVAASPSVTDNRTLLMDSGTSVGANIRQSGNGSLSDSEIVTLLAVFSADPETQRQFVQQQLKLKDLNSTNSDDDDDAE